MFVPAYLALQQKGFVVRWVRSKTDPAQETWYAENETVEFIADDPLTLLGLVSIYETRGDNWQASDAQIMEFLERY